VQILVNVAKVRLKSYFCCGNEAKKHPFENVSKKRSRIQTTPTAKAKQPTAQQPTAFLSLRTTLSFGITSCGRVVNLISLL